MIFSNNLFTYASDDSELDTISDTNQQTRRSKRISKSPKWMSDYIMATKEHDHSEFMTKIRL